MVAQSVGDVGGVGGVGWWGKGEELTVQVQGAGFWTLDSRAEERAEGLKRWLTHRLTRTPN